MYQAAKGELAELEGAGEDAEAVEMTQDLPGVEVRHIPLEGYGVIGEEEGSDG